jgi:hypothetical protein
MKNGIPCIVLFCRPMKAILHGFFFLIELRIFSTLFRW